MLTTYRVIKEFNMGTMSAGNHSLKMNGAPLEAGYYFYTLQTNDDQVTRRMAVTK